MKVENLIPENAHINQELSLYVRFRKFDGKFICHFDTDDEKYDILTMALDNYFTLGQIRSIFKIR